MSWPAPQKVTRVPCKDGHGFCEREGCTFVNNWLAIGTIQSCKTVQCKRKLCIYKSCWPHYCKEVCPENPDQPMPDYPVPPVFDGPNLRFNYADGDPFTADMFNALDRWAVELRTNREPTLIHCHAGMCRSPTCAAYLLARVAGCDLFEAMAVITRAIWPQRGRIPNWCHRCLDGLAARLEVHL